MNLHWCVYLTSMILPISCRLFTISTNNTRETSMYKEDMKSSKLGCILRCEVDPMCDEVTTSELASGGWKCQLMKESATSSVSLIGTVLYTMLRLPDVNLAVGKHASMPSTYRHYGDDLTADRAVDGVVNGSLSDKSCALSNAHVDPWLRVDLGGVAEVRKVKVYNRVECCGNRLNNFTVQIDSLSCGSGGIMDYIAMKELTCPKRTVGRHAVVKVYGYQIMQICELKIFGQWYH